MAIEKNFRDEKLQYDINTEAAKNQDYHQSKLINMNILYTNKYHLLIKEE